MDQPAAAPASSLVEPVWAHSTSLPPRVATTQYVVFAARETVEAGVYVVLCVGPSAPAGAASRLVGLVIEATCVPVAGFPSRSVTLGAGVSRPRARTRNGIWRLASV